MSENDTWMSLPGDYEELYELFTSRSSHPAMKMASNALYNKRSTKQAFILLLGTSGAGKSSTVNYLFDSKIADISHSKSKTSSTIEYVVETKSTEWRIPDLALSIIDTPGFGDTRGLVQDAKNMLSIKYFLRNHPFMKGNKEKTNYPNIVLIVHDIQDKRFEGDESQFVKMLKGIKIINVIDYNKPNVVLVLTNVAKTPFDVWEESIFRIRNLLTAITKSTLEVEPEVVLQENLPDVFKLKKADEYHVLPNGDKQPKMLFKACKKLLKAADDKLGYEALAVCFRHKEPLTSNVKPGYEVSSENMEAHEVETMCLAMERSPVKKSDSEVANMLEKYKDSITNKGDQLESDILMLQMKLRDLKIKHAKDIQTMTMNQLASEVYPMRIDGQLERILENTFGIKYEQVTSFDLYIGHGFNVLTDSKSALRPLVLSRDKGKYGLPSDIDLKPCSKHVGRCESVTSAQEYITERLRSLDIIVGSKANFLAFVMKMQAGYNSNESTMKSKTSSENGVSFAIEHKIYEARLEQPYKMVPELKTDIEKLPDSYDFSNEDSFNAWKAFFEKWGYYVITGVDIGALFLAKSK